jgi:transcription-repair coupling factor (superfamily II helicase)
MTPAPAPAGTRFDAPLHHLPGVLRDEPALARVLGRTSATLAVAESARAIVTAGLAGLTNRRPIVLAVPTSTEAERVAHDVAAYLGDDAVDLFPA